ncbi:MAG: DUF5591 domain-containing protein [Thermoplasmata archaeon]|nr:DUF5591 domain-containing protein [Thermoplasmata archaeon]
MTSDKKGRWEYRFETIDGTARSGYFIREQSRLRLPVIFDLKNLGGEQPLAVGSSSDPSWEGVEVQVNRSPGVVDPTISDALRDALRGMRISDMGGAVNFWKLKVECSSGDTCLKLPVLDVPLSAMLEQDARRLARLMGTLTKENPAHEPIYLPGAAGGENIELLLYMGVEVFDTSRSRLDGLEGIYYTPTGTLSWEEDSREITGSNICTCEACKALFNGEERNAGTLLGDHNSAMLERRLGLASIHLARGTLRQHVSGLISGSPRHATMFRLFEELNEELLSGNAPTWRKRGKPRLSYREDLRSGEFTCWERRLTEDYVPPQWKDILLLLPCSARKPYSLSRTHMRIAENLGDIGRWRDRVHRVVITSPLGAVPMELEELYPAAYYDLPVTGAWYPEEIARTRRVVRSLVEKGSYSEIISFHTEGVEFFGDELDGDTLYGLPYTDPYSMSGDPVQALKEKLTSILEAAGNEGVPSNCELSEQLKLIEFTLGIDLSGMGGLRYFRSRRGKEIRKGKAHFIDLRLGGPVPTSSTAEMIWNRLSGEGRGKRVLIDEFVPRGTIFNQGIIKAEGGVHPGDIVFISSEGGYKGMGRALVPQAVMNTGLKGPSVKIISHVKDH